jgi:hypothetical protein
MLKLEHTGGISELGCPIETDSDLFVCMSMLKARYKGAIRFLVDKQTDAILQDQAIRDKGVILVPVNGTTIHGTKFCSIPINVVDENFGK